MDLKQYLTSLFNTALDRGQDWIDSEFGKLLDIEYEKHGYEMLHVLKDVIINPNTDDWCVEMSLVFYTYLARSEYKLEIINILYEILIKHENYIYAGGAAMSLLSLKSINLLEQSLEIVQEEKRKQQILSALLRHAAGDGKYKFGLNQVLNVIITLNQNSMNNMIEQSKTDPDVIEATITMLNSKYVTKLQRQNVLNLLEKNMLEKDFNSMLSKVVT